MRALFDRLFRAFMWRFSRLYGTWLCWRGLDGVYAQGLARTRALAAEGPIILACNHACWWDGIFVLMMQHWLGVRGRFLVDQGSADSMPFIDTFGGIGVARDNVTKLAEALEVAAGFLDGPQRAVILFPQGRFRPAHVRPLGMHRGVALLQRWSKAPIVPVSLTFGFLDTHLPACVMTFGEPIPAGRRDVMDVLEARIVQGLDEHTAWLDDLSRPPRYEPVVPTGIVPIERRPFSLMYLGGVTILRALFRRGP